MFLNGFEFNPYVLNTKRRLCGYTQVELANRCGLHQSRISLIESNDANPSEDEKKKIEAVLGEIIWKDITVNDGDNGYGSGYDTRCGRFTYIEYARFADDLVVLIDGFRKWEWLLKAAYKRLVEEFEKLGVQMNQEKTRIVDLSRDETFSFLGFNYRRVKTRRDVWGVRVTPRMKARTALLRELKDVFRRHQSQPVDRVIYLINPILRGWVNYFRVGNSSECFGYIKDWVEKKIRRHLMRARKRRGFGWKRWSRAWFYNTLGLFYDYGVRYYQV